MRDFRYVLKHSICLATRYVALRQRDLKRSDNMKKLNSIDKIVIFIVVLSFLNLFIGFVFTEMLYDNSLLHKISAINNFYILFLIPLTVFVGIILNIMSLVLKSTVKTSFKLNVWMFVMFILMLPGWQHFFWQVINS